MTSRAAVVPLRVSLVGQVVECPDCHRSIAIVALEDGRVVLARHDNRNNSGFCKASIVRADGMSIACAPDCDHDLGCGDCLGWVHGWHPVKYGICTCPCHRKDDDA